MTYIIYTSKDRNDETGTTTISSGHSDATEYTIDFAPRVLERSLENRTITNQALDGSIQQTHLSHSMIWNVETGFVTLGDSTWDIWQEFLHSVRGGEVFQWHPYNASTASPNGAYNVVLNNVNWSVNRAADFIDKFSFGFQIRANENL